VLQFRPFQQELPEKMRFKETTDRQTEYRQTDGMTESHYHTSTDNNGR